MADSNEEVNSMSQSDHLNFLRCFLCNRSYSKPKLLPCLHSFCFDCLDKTYSSQTTGVTKREVNSCDEGYELPQDKHVDDVIPQPDVIVCPMCKTKANLPKIGIDGFKDNLLVMEMIRRWEDKLCENEPKPKRLSPSKTPSSYSKSGVVDANDTSNNSQSDTNENTTCKCLPFWKNISMGNSSSEKSKQQKANGQEFDVGMHGPNGNGLHNQYFCVTCELIVCGYCKQHSHSKHHITESKEAIAERHEYLKHLLSDLDAKNHECETSLVQIDNSAEHIVSSAEQIIKQVEERSRKMIETINEQRENLIEELAIVLKQNKQKMSDSKTYLQTQNEKLKAATKFTKGLLEYGSGSDLMYLTNDVSDRLLELLKHKLSYHRNVMNIRLEVPVIGYDSNHFHKLFGSLKQSEVKCGSAELLQSFDLDLKWPTGMAATLNRDFVVTGKMGAFEEKGKVMFFTKSGNLKTEYELDDHCIPYDTTVTRDGLVLVADNGGNIHKFDSAGRKLATMVGKFQGVGRLATIHQGQGQFVITSSDEKKVKIYNYNGNLEMCLPKDGSGVHLEHPHYVATNKLFDIVVSDFKLHAVFVFDARGNLKFKYSGNGVDAGELKCPSAVCCDNYDNILVADFMNDRVHMISPNGQFLGYLLTKENSITCPNFLSTDGEGRLYVGQYGGQIQVFQYMGYLKFV